MKKLKFVLLVFGLLVMGNNLVNAQSYKNAIGLRFAWDYGLSFKHFMNETAAFEIIASHRSYSAYYVSNYSYSYTRLSALYLVHNPISSVEGLKWYYGGGLTAAFWGGDFNYDNNGKSSTSLGIVGALGLEYKFASTPITISGDWLPTFFFSGYGNGFGGEAGGLAVRYTF